MKHRLKIEHRHFQDVLNLYKRFEIRFNDRDYKVGDLLELHEMSEDLLNYTGNVLTVKVNYLLDDFVGLAPGYVAMNIVRVGIV